MKSRLARLVVCLELVAQVLGYSKVSRYGQARSAPEAGLVLRPGEALDHPSTPKYSTLDEEQLSKLDGSAARKNPQQRFHPPAGFEHVLSHMGPTRQQRPTSASREVIYPKPVVSMTYDYPSSGYESEPKPMLSKPPAASSFPSYAQPQFPEPSYPAKPSSGPATIYASEPAGPPKSIDFPEHYSPYGDGPPGYHEDEVIYDHLPEDHYPHHHHYHPPPSSTTMEPEMMDQRLNKRPYSYYYIGKKLWYVPLYFSIYFIIYIAALVLKSIARHKISFPAHLAAAANGARSEQEPRPGWMDYAATVLEAIEKYGSKFAEDAASGKS